ncbi:MAG: 4Fe-4S binding protein [Bdellovibrio sp.]|nr:4Fe-4S binding protein [Bdellovibrio sp.]
MVRESVFRGIGIYIRNVFLGVWSIAGSCFTAVPYLFRLGELRKEVTEGYPDPVSSKTADDLPPRSRGLLFNDIDRCSGCRDCEKICPAQCIKIDCEPGSEASKVWVSVFDIDFSKCVFCGLCTEVCLPSSLVHTRQYEGAAYSLKDLVASFGRGQLTPEQRAKWAAMRKLSEDGEGVSL